MSPLRSYLHHLNLGLLALWSVIFAQTVSGSPDEPAVRLIEVFIATSVAADEPVIACTHPDVARCQIYTIDAISCWEEAVSRGLPANPERAKARVLQQLQAANGVWENQIENAATGLAKALHYGLDRYPAIVVDGHFVVYGLTDLEAALNQVASWQAVGGR